MNVNVVKGFMQKQVYDYNIVFFEISEICRDGLVDYDAALTQLRSWVVTSTVVTSCLHPSYISGINRNSNLLSK